MQRAQVIGVSRVGSIGCLQDLLIALMDQLGNLTIDEVPGIGKDFHRALGSALDGGRDLVLLKEPAAARTGRFQDIEAVITKPLQRVFERPGLDLRFRHSRSSSCTASSGSK